MVIASVTLADDGDYVLQATNAEACGGGLVLTSLFVLDVDDTDPNCTAGAPVIFNVDTVLNHNGQPLSINVTLDHVTNPPVMTESRIGGIQIIEITFDQPMDPTTSEETDNITVTGVNQGLIDPLDMLATLEVTKGLVLTLTFPGLTGGVLPIQDRYTIELAEAIQDTDEQSLTSDREFDIRALKADTNGDGFVDPLDNGGILARYGTAVELNVRYDINQDGAIDPLDSGAALAQYGFSAP